jgi:WXG100 family type VII secretion target
MTDFSKFSHPQLIAMLYAGDPQTVRAASGTWDSTGGTLHDRANDLEKQLRSFSDKWSGGAAQQYHTMINDLANGIRKVAGTAYDVRDLTASAAEAQEKARQAMPRAQSVPALCSSPAPRCPPTPACPRRYSSSWRNGRRQRSRRSRSTSRPPPPRTRRTSRRCW